MPQEKKQQKILLIPIIQKVTKKVIFTDRSNPILTAYLKEISKFKIYDVKTIIDLVKKAQDGDISARDKVIKSNLRFVVTLAKQFQGRGVPLMDLISEGAYGLMQAITHFKPEKGTTFIFYSVYWIKQALYRAIYWQSRDVRLPLSQYVLITKILKATSEFLQKNKRNPSSKELSEITGIEEAQIDYLAQFKNKVASFEEKVSHSDESMELSEVISDNEMLLDEKLHQNNIYKELSDIINSLSDREHDLICMLFGIGMPAVNHHVVGAMFGVGRERVRQMKDTALAKLRRKCPEYFRSAI